MSISFMYVLIYYTFLVFSTVFRIKITDKQYNLLNILFIISIFMVAYYFVPSSNLDLYRYYEMLNVYKRMSWQQSIESGIYSNTIITNIYFFVMSRVDNIGLFSAIPTALTFSIIFFMSTKFRKIYKISYQTHSFYILGIISVASLIGIISGIRQNLSWALLMLALYYDYYIKDNNKIILIILYTLPPLVHLSSVPFIVIRIGIVFIKKIGFFKYLIILWPLFIGLISNFYFILPPVFQSSFQLLEFHTSYSGGAITYKRIFAVFGYLIFLYLVKKINNNDIKNNLFVGNTDFNIYYLSVILFGISSIFVDLILFGRNIELILYLSLPIIADLFKSKFTFRQILIFTLLVMYLALFYLQDIKPGYFLRFSN